MKIVLGVVMAIAALVFIGFCASRTNTMPVEPRPYGELRRALIETSAHAGPSRGQPPVRPPDLDMRVGSDVAARLQSLYPPTQESRREYFDLYNQVIDSVRAELRALDPDHDWYELLSPARRALVLLENLEMEVNNGGFDQYYVNSSGDGAALTPESLRLLHANAYADLVERANAAFPGGPPMDRNLRLQLLDQMPDSTWHEYTDAFFDLGRASETDAPESSEPVSVFTFMMSYRSEFFRDR